MTQLSIIIISYNTEKLLDQCLASLMQNINMKDYEIIVIDNNSKDESTQMIQKKYPKVRLVINKENRGFARAVNQGLKMSQGKMIMLLNPDTVIPKDTVRTMYNYLIQTPKVGVIGCQLKNMDGTLQNTFGNFPTILSEFFFATGMYKLLALGRIIVNSEEFKKPMHVDWVGGACQMFHRSLLNEIGMLDEKFCLYLEDIDWCYRVKQHGYTNIYIPEVFLFHHLSASSGGSRKLLPIWFNSRNSVYFQLKHQGKISAQLVRHIVSLQLKLQEIRWKIHKKHEYAKNYQRVQKRLKTYTLNDFNKPANLEELKNV